MKELQLDNLIFDDKGLIPAIVQDVNTKDVLMMAWMNQVSLQKTLQTKNTWFYSRSRQKLWMKGETSGNTQTVKEIRYDCDNDTLLILVEAKGVACHTGEDTCFHRTLDVSKGSGSFGTRPQVQAPEEITEVTSAIEGSVLEKLYQLIAQRKKEMPDGSYTSDLFKEGIGKIAAKVSEESTEVIEAAFEKEKKEIIWESADLLYHLLVLMAAKDVTLKEVEAELQKRSK